MLQWCYRNQLKKNASEIRWIFQELFSEKRIAAAVDMQICKIPEEASIPSLSSELTTNTETFSTIEVAHMPMNSFVSIFQPGIGS